MPTKRAKRAGGVAFCDVSASRYPQVRLSFDGGSFLPGPACPPTLLASRAVSLTWWRLGDWCLTGVSPSSSRHVFILFSASLPWRELGDLARTLALRFSSGRDVPYWSDNGLYARNESWRVLTCPGCRPAGPARRLWILSRAGEDAVLTSLLSALGAL